MGVAVVLSRVLADDGSPTLYAEEVRQEMERIERLVPTFQSLIVDLGQVDRIVLNETIEELVSALDTTESFVIETTPPPEAEAVPVLLEESIGAWRDGLQRFRTAMLRAADEPASTTAESELVAAFIDLQVGDRVYGSAVARLDAADIPAPVTPLPTVTFFPRSFPMAGTAATLVAFAAADASPLELRAVLGIEQVTTDPAWIVDVTDALVIESTSTVVVKVVVANTGNTESIPTTVGVEWVSSTGTVQTRVLEVPALSAQSTTTLSTDPLEVAPGIVYELLVGMPAVDPEVTDPSRERSFQIRINEEVVTTTTAADGDAGDGEDGGDG